MKVVKFLLSLLITVTLIYLLDNRWVVNGNPVPPLGKFLDPFHGFWRNLERNQNRAPLDEFTVPGLKGKVTIILDSLAIPHLFAENDEDLYFAQGYVTAMHRLWQMELQTHAAAGRVSEIVGPVGLNNDRYMRRLGMGFGAEQALQLMQSNPTARMIVEQYTNGINAYIATLNDQNLPFEYKLLDYKPERWTPLKCALVLMNMSRLLNMGDKDIEMTNALKLFGKDAIALLYPDHEMEEDPVVDKPGGWNFDPIKLDTVPLAVPDELIALHKMPGSDPDNGSNNWAVAGSKTKTGSPILCGDPHLTLSLPSIWYVLQMNAPGVNTMGASLPGAPGIVIGFTDSVAWSITNAQRDLVDWFKIKYFDDKREKYFLDDGWVHTRKVVERFVVRGQQDVYDTIVYTHWGPVTYDRNFHGENNLNDYSFRWTAHHVGEELMTLYKLNRARNHADYMEALDHFASPGQNFVFASVSGDVAMRVQAKYPVRRKNEGKFVLDGTKSSEGWQAFIPNAHNVMDKNPARGFVSSANQYPADSSYPYYITAPEYETYRNRRINQVLRESGDITVEDMMKLQNDNYNLKAAESVPVFLSYLDSTLFNAEERDAYTILKSWNYFNDVESMGASYYEAWLNNLEPLVWDEMESEKLDLARPTIYNTIKLIKEKPDLIFFDLQQTAEKETAKDIVQKAFSLAVEDIADWKAEHPNTEPGWADFKDSYIGHLLRLQPLSVHVRAPGNSDIVNALSKTHGPSWRMVVSLEKTGLKAWGVYPGGQSGNPGSRFYSNLIDRWTKGQYYQFSFLHKPEDLKSSTSLVFIPAEQ